MAATDEGLTPIRLETRTSRAFGQGAWVYLLDGVLVDSGFSHAREALLRSLAGRRVARVVNTHAHEDHTGNDAAVAEAFGAAVLAPRGALHLLAAPEKLHMRFYERLIWGPPGPCPSAAALGGAVETSRGRLDVVPTPGHSPEHVAFFEPERRWLFTGDLYLGPRVKAARPFENAADLAESLRRVLALRPARMFCAHRGAIDAPVPALEAKLRFVEDLRARVAELAGKATPVGAIARRSLGRERASMWLLTWGDYSQRHLVQACLREPGAGYQQPGSVEY